VDDDDSAVPESETVTGASTSSADLVTAVVDRFNEAWGRHDLEAALALLSDDCVFEATSPAPDGIRHVGPAAIRSAWQPIFDDTSSRFTVEESFATDRQLVQLWRYDWADGHVRGVDAITVHDGLIAAKLSYVKG
jgi:ketosteroid isomerase-like protein